jgi:hypothetical protein
MDEEGGGSAVAVCGKRRWRIRADGREAKEHEFAVTLDSFNAAAGQVLFEGDGIVNEIGFAEADGENAAAEDRAAEATGDGFDFGEFGHLEI